jgi:hypothetical protein
MPVRGLHLMAPRQEDVAVLTRFIREAMPKEGVNTLVLEKITAYNIRNDRKFRIRTP